MLSGELFTDEKAIGSSKLWSFHEPIMLKFLTLNCIAFTFKGKLTSELLDHSLVKYGFEKKKGEIVNPELLKEEGFNGFCLRAHIVPITGVNANLYLVVYPMPAEDLVLEYEAAKNPFFPGILLSKSEIKLGPKYSTILDEAIGTTILPALIVGSPLSSVPTVPSTQEILSRQATLLRTAIIPETKSSRSTMIERWEIIQEEGEKHFKKAVVDPVWPELDCQVNSGKLIFCFCYIH